MKKIISGILSVLFIISSIPTFAAFTTYESYYNNNDKRDFVDTIGLFEALGVTDVNDRSDIATTVSRGKMAKLLANTFKLEGWDTSKAKYTDVPEEHEYAKYIYSVSEHGYMVGTEENEFSPDEDVTFEQSVVIISRALGYDLLAYEAGGYPLGYITVATKNGLLDGVSNNGSNPISYGSLVKLLMNALSAPRMVSDFSTSDPSYSLDKNNTLMKYVWKIEELYGVITSIGEAKLYNGKSIEKGDVEINGVTYKTECDVRDKLGCKVKYYAALEASENTAVYICSSDTYNTIIQVMSEDICGLSGTTYSVEINGRKKDYKFSGNTCIIYNGRATASLSETDLVPEDGYIRMIDNNGDNIYDVLFVWAFKSDVVEFVDSDGWKIYCENNSFDFSELKSTEELTVYNADNVEIDFTVIKSPGVVSVAEDMNNESAVIFYSDASIKGKIQIIEDEYFYIDGKAYRQRCGDKYSPKLGVMTVFYIDCRGIIRGLKLLDSESMLGMMLKVKCIDNGISEDMQIKIFNENGEMVIYHVSEKVKIDGVNYKKISDAFNALLFETQATITVDGETIVVYEAGELAVPQLISYKLNDDGVIREIDTPYNWKQNMLAGSELRAELKGTYDPMYETAQSLHLMSMTDRGYVAQQNSIDGYCLVNGSTKFFIMPNSAEPGRSDSRKEAVKEANDMEFEIATQSQLPANNKYFWCDAYSSDDRDFYAKALVCWSGMSAGKSTYGVVTKVYSALDYDENVVRGMDVATTSATSQMHLTVRDGFEFDAVEPGDIVSITTNSRNEIIGGRRYYDLSENTWYTSKLGPTESNSYASTTLAFVGNVYDVYDGSASVVATLDDWNESPPSEKDIQLKRIYNASKFNVLIFDREYRSEAVKQGSYKDIIPYKGGNNDYSKVAIVTVNGAPKLMVVYR